MAEMSSNTTGPSVSGGDPKMAEVWIKDVDGAALDWLVAMAQGRREIKVFAPLRWNDSGWIEVRFNPEPRAQTARFSPSSDREQGGSIMEGECFDTLYIGNGADEHRWRVTAFGGLTFAEGPTPLVAGMRCFLRSRVGEKALVPAKLIELPERPPGAVPASNVQRERHRG